MNNGWDIVLDNIGIVGKRIDRLIVFVEWFKIKYIIIDFIIYDRRLVWNKIKFKYFYIIFIRFWILLILFIIKLEKEVYF